MLEDHFSVATKMVTIGSGAERRVKDYFLSKRACHLIAQNGDPEKVQISIAQNYFSFATEAYEMHQLRVAQEERIEKRLHVTTSMGAVTETACLVDNE